MVEEEVKFKHDVTELDVCLSTARAIGHERDAMVDMMWILASK